RLAWEGCDAVHCAGRAGNRSALRRNLRFAIAAGVPAVAHDVGCIGLAFAISAAISTIGTGFAVAARMSTFLLSRHCDFVPSDEGGARFPPLPLPGDGYGKG